MLQFTQCPCGSETSFANCCEPIIKQESAATALQLMKSRYTAYCIGDADYLYKTLVPQNRKHQNKEDIAQWSNENHWIKLEIINCELGGTNNNKGIVTFKAFYKDAHGCEQIHHERSSFCKVNEQWYYIDGQLNPQSKPTSTDRNALCLCGSGKKYKKCCLNE